MPSPNSCRQFYPGDELRSRRAPSNGYETHNLASPSHLAIGFANTLVNRLRLWKDDDGGGGQNIKNLTIQYTTDLGPLSSR
jgi:hypothetical protein